MLKLTVEAAFSYFTLLIFSFPKLYYVTSHLTSWGCTKHYHSASAFPNVTSWIIQMNICFICVLRKKNLWNNSLPGGRRRGKGCRPRKFCCGSVFKGIACKTRFLAYKHSLSVALMLAENQLFWGPISASFKENLC